VVEVEAYSERWAVAEEAGGRGEGEQIPTNRDTGGGEAANRDHEKRH